MKRLALVLLVVSNLVVAGMVYAGPTYRLEFKGPPGDFISGGQHVVLTEHDVGLSTSVADLTGDGLVDSVQFNSSGVGQLSFLLFFDTDKIPGNLVSGVYPDAQRSPFADPGHPGFWLAWDHRGCNRIAGSYTIFEAVFGPSGPTRFSVQFEQSCEEFMPPLTGTFEFTVPVMVDCSTTSLQQALLSASPGDTIAVTGTCNENILVRNDKVRVFLNGGGTAVINGPDSSRPALDVRGKAISIQGFTITGGSSGIEVQRGSNAVINDNVIQNTGGHGVVVNQLAFGVLTNNTVRNNPGDGVVVEGGAAGRIGFNSGSEQSPSPNTIQFNNGNGITVTGSSSVRAVGNNINSNGGHGVRVMGASQGDFSNNSINNNDDDGIFVTQNSAVQLGQDPALFAAANSGTANGGFGISCDSGGTLDGLIGSLSGNMGPANIDASCSNSLSP